MCSGVIGLFGEPFDIETSAVLTFKVDKSMLGDTEFDNLLFLWYDEENEDHTMYQLIIVQMLL